MKQRQRTIYLVTIAAMLAMVGGYALAATTVTTLTTPQSSNVTSGGTPGGFSSIASVTSEQLVTISTSMSTATSAGTQGAGIGLSGTTVQLATCSASPCAAQNFKAASPAATVGNYGEQLTLNAFQSTANSAVGFDMTVTVTTSTTTVVAFAYLELPTSPPSSQTIVVYLFVDLGSSTAPVITGVSVVFNQCATGTICP
jgi:hypothetical protein